MSKPLQGRVAIVTGTARKRGIGRAIALRLAQDGADIVCSGLPRDPSTFPDHEREAGWLGVASVAEEIEGLGQRALSVDCDIANRRQVEEMVKRATSELGGIDILVNNAALPSEAGVSPILDMDDDNWYRTVDVNLNGLYLVTKAVGIAMRDAAKGGAIINISSAAGRVGLPNYGAYCATKWGMLGMTQQLAVELAPFGIRVNCICPGSTDTDMMDGTFRRTAEKYGGSIEQSKEMIARGLPLGRQGRPEEQAAAVSFLAGPDASYITGQTLNVDGGMRMD